MAQLPCKLSVPIQMVVTRLRTVLYAVLYILRQSKLRCVDVNVRLLLGKGVLVMLMNGLLAGEPPKLQVSLQGP